MKQILVCIYLISFAHFVLASDERAWDKFFDEYIENHFENLCKKAYPDYKSDENYLQFQTAIIKVKEARDKCNKIIDFPSDMDSFWKAYKMIDVTNANMEIWASNEYLDNEAFADILKNRYASFLLNSLSVIYKHTIDIYNSRFKCLENSPEKLLRKDPDFLAKLSAERR